MWGLAFFVLAVFPCNPIAKDWHPQLDGTCIGWGSKDPDKFFQMFLGHSASNMVLDLLVLVVPIPFLSMLRIAGKSKVGLITLFTLGIVYVLLQLYDTTELTRSSVCAVSIGRLISLSVNRAGTIPILDMPYHTPIVYLFSVLEVNIAIIAASIPIFWPVIATLASNKIWVVNEIEVRVEETSRGSVSTNGEIGLEERGSWSKLDSKDEYGGRTKSTRLSVITKPYDLKEARNGHRHKASNTSSIGRTMGLELGTRASQDSQRNLCRIQSGDAGTRNPSLTRSDKGDWFAGMDRQNKAGPTTTIGKTGVSLERINTLGK
jgi:hypothetical protein